MARMVAKLVACFIFSNWAWASRGWSSAEARSSEASTSEASGFSTSEARGFSTSEARLRHAASSCITHDTQHSASPHPTHAFTHHPAKFPFFLAGLFDPNLSRVETFTFFVLVLCRRAHTQRQRYNKPARALSQTYRRLSSQDTLCSSQQVKHAAFLPLS